jgi:hypothetical protein
MSNEASAEPLQVPEAKPGVENGNPPASAKDAGSSFQAQISKLRGSLSRQDVRPLCKKWSRYKTAEKFLTLNLQRLQAKQRESTALLAQINKLTRNYLKLVGQETVLKCAVQSDRNRLTQLQCLYRRRMIQKEASRIREKLVRGVTTKVRAKYAKSVIWTQSDLI